MLLYGVGNNNGGAGKSDANSRVHFKYYLVAYVVNNLDAIQGVTLGFYYNIILTQMGNLDINLEMTLDYFHTGKGG